MKYLINKAIRQLFLVVIASCSLTACVGTVVGVVVDTAVEVVKIPFKVGGAVIDVVTPDDFSDNLLSNDNEGELDIDSEAAAVEMESQAF